MTSSYIIRQNGCVLTLLHEQSTMRHMNKDTLMLRYLNGGGNVHLALQYSNQFFLLLGYVQYKQNASRVIFGCPVRRLD